MFLDLIATDNQISCNVKAAKLLGLDTAIYLNELININAKAISKGKVDSNGFFLLKRTYITDRTTLSVYRQLELDKGLENVEIISKDPNDQDRLKVDIEMYASILANQDTSIANKVEKLATKKTKTEKDQEKREAIANNLKLGVRCNNDELRMAYYGWIDSVCSKPNGFLSKSVIKIFEDTINNYAKGDLDLALALLKIATINAYKNAEWAINIYEKDKNQLRTTQNRVDTPTTLSEISY